MAPPSTDVDIATEPTADVSFNYGTKKIAATKLTEPLNSAGTLDRYESFDVTSVIGREFPKLQLSSILNDDAKIRDLAITGQISSNLSARLQLC
jgi:hypothetical protein